MSNLGKSQDLEQAIFATIAYYDYFNYPLTAREIYSYLIRLDFSHSSPPVGGEESLGLSEKKNLAFARDSSTPLRSAQDDKIKRDLKPSFSEILKTLDESELLKKVVGRKNGFYFLKDREEIITQRIRRKKLTDQKFKKSKWILRFLSYLPFVRLIMMSGTMAMGNPYKESDIDLLVVAKAGRIWTTRAFLTFFAMLFGKYRAGKKTENRLCFNHYITDKSLAIDFGNLYKAEEYLNLIPIAGDLEIYDDFFSANKSWMGKYIFAGGDNRENLRTFAPMKIFLETKYFSEYLLSGFIGNALEKTFKKIQIFFIQKNPLSNRVGGRLRYADDNLVFHPVLVEGEVIKKHEEKLAELKVNLS